MKKIVPIFCLLLCALLASAQSPPISTTLLQLPLNYVLPQPATQASITIVGNPGPGTECYWLVTNYTVGQSSPQLVGCPTNVPNVLSSSNYMTITPVYPAGIVSIDLLKTATPTQPSGACGCAVTTGATSGSISDQSNSTSAYTINPVNVNALQLTLDNEVEGADESHLILRQNGVFVVDLSVSSGSGTVTSIGTTFPITGGTIISTGTIGLTTSCSTNQVLAWNGTAWTCSTPSTGTITGATSGGGLVVTSTTLGLLTSCSTNQVLQWSGSAWVCSSAGTGTVTTLSALPSSTVTFVLPAYTTTPASSATVIAPSIFAQNNPGTPYSGNNAIISPTGILGLEVQNSVPGSSECSVGSPTVPSQMGNGAGYGCFGAILGLTYPSSIGSTSQTAGIVVTNQSNLSSLEEMEGGVFYVRPSTGALWGVGVEADVFGSATARQTSVLAYAQALAGLTTQQGVYALTSVSGSVTVLDNYGVYVDSPSLTTGTLTHNYAVYIADQTVAGSGTNSDPWGIYEAGTAKNQLGGALTVPNFTATGANVLFSGLASLPSSGNYCLQIGSTGVISTTGAGCGSGSGSSITINGGSALSSPVNFENGSAVDGITINFANPSASNVTAAISGALTSAGLNITTTTCTNQFIDAISSGAVGTCASVGNAALVNSAITIAGTSVSLGGSTTSFPSPGVIGGTTPAAITGTTIQANTQINAGVSGTLAPIVMGNATSGTLTLEPGTGAITSYTLQLPTAQPSASSEFLTCTSANPSICTFAAAGSGTVNSGTQYQMGYYAATGTAISGDSNITTDSAGDLNIAGNETAATNNTNGSAGGAMTVSAGLASQPVGSSVGFQAPEQITAGTQYNVDLPETSAAGVFIGTIVATAPTVTCTVSSGVVTSCATSFSAGSATSSLGYAGAPPCAISTTGTFTTKATCVFVMSGSYPNEIPASVTTTGGGTGYTGTVTATVPGGGPVNLQYFASTPILYGGTNATSAAAGTVPNATSPTASSWTSTVTLGASGTLGSIAMGNATSGTVTLEPVTGALGTVTASLPANTGPIAELNLSETWTANQLFNGYLYSGVLIRTTSYTGNGTADSGNLIVMNCSAACTYTFNGSPTNGYNGGVVSIGSTLATISLNSKNFNGSSSVPALTSYRVLPFNSDGNGYYGEAPLVAGTGITFTSASNGLTLAASSAISSCGTSDAIPYYSGSTTISCDTALVDTAANTGSWNIGASNTWTWAAGFGWTLTGTAPSSSTGAGTAGPTFLTITPPAGGASSSATANGGQGSNVLFDCGGTGGANTNGSGTGNGGAGGTCNITGAAGGASTNNNGGSGTTITITGGAGGSGGNNPGAGGNVALVGGSSALTAGLISANPCFELINGSNTVYLSPVSSNTLDVGTACGNVSAAISTGTGTFGSGGVSSTGGFTTSDATAYSMTASGTAAIVNNASNAVGLSSNGTESLRDNGTEISVTKPFCGGSSIASTTPCFVTPAGGVWMVNTSTTNTGSLGFFKADGNIVVQNASSQSAVTTSTCCSTWETISIPSIAAAKNWSFHCFIPYTTAGTTQPALIFGIEVGTNAASFVGLGGTINNGTAITNATVGYTLGSAPSTTTWTSLTGSAPSAAGTYVATFDGTIEIASSKASAVNFGTAVSGGTGTPSVAIAQDAFCHLF